MKLNIKIRFNKIASRQKPTNTRRQSFDALFSIVTKNQSPSLIHFSDELASKKLG